ncbi:MAG: helix-turn-helix domain-containing protein [Treponema sp.]|jgi:DNA-binding Lrp family transcriptional regulator|nr:helix-turn-helix domain-containing protein [Treponema sp.]
MNDLTKQGEQKMTVKEVADVLGLDPRTIRYKVQELFPEIMQNGKTTYLSENQAAMVKMNLEKNFQVKTSLEKS